MYVHTHIYMYIYDIMNTQSASKNIQDESVRGDLVYINIYIHTHVLARA